MHPELEVYLGLYFRAKSELYRGEVFELLDRAGATEEDHDLLFELLGVQAGWEFERDKARRKS